MAANRAPTEEKYLWSVVRGPRQLRCWGGSGLHLCIITSVSDPSSKLHLGGRVKLSRGEFLKLIAGVAGATLVPKVSANPWGLPLGIQLYTVRNDLETDFTGVLQKLAGMGYQEVEAGFTDSGEIQFHGGPVTEFRKRLEDAGLRVLSAHFPVPKNDAEWHANVERAHTLNLQYMVCAGPPGVTDSLDAWKRAGAFFNRLGTVCRSAGMQFAYHNHNHEFVVYEGVIGYDELLRSTDPTLVKMELDCFWMTFAGKDPVEYMRRYPGRFPLLHIKGLKAGFPPTTGHFEGNPFTEVGNGVIDWKRIFLAARGGGLKHYYVEQDQWDRPSLESAAISAAYLKKLQVGSR
jgi:sugar phosphate isomerase/epimerase